MHELGLVGVGQFAARLAGRDRERRQHHQLAGEGLGRGDADFRAGQRRQHGLAFARDGRGRHVDHGERVHALRLGVAQRRQRVGGLAGLRNEDRQIALAQRRLAVAEFGGDIEFDRHARKPLEPVFGDIAGIARGAAGGDRDALDVLEIERQLYRQRHALGRHVDIARQRMADHFGLLVDFLGHEMAIIRLVDQERRGAGLQHLAIHHRAVLVIDHADFAGQHHPVAVLEIADGVGEGRERDRVRAQIHLAVAMADRQRRALAGADHQIAVALEHEGQRERAAQLRQRRLHRILRRSALEQVGIDQMDHDLGVGFALEFARPAFPASARSSRKFSMMPLWTTATLSVACGCALLSVGLPWVAQRVCPMPVWPASGSARSRVSRFFSLPSARRRSRWSPSSVATPAES